MTKNQYKQREKELFATHEQNRIELAKEYAMANNPYNVGDIVTDHIGPFKIEKIGYYISFDDPCCQYSGVRLKKDLTPAKNNQHNICYQTNILKP